MLFQAENPDLRQIEQFFDAIVGCINHKHKVIFLFENCIGIQCFMRLANSSESTIEENFVVKAKIISSRVSWF